MIFISLQLQSTVIEKSRENPELYIWIANLTDRLNHCYFDWEVTYLARALTWTIRVLRTESAELELQGCLEKGESGVSGLCSFYVPDRFSSLSGLGPCCCFVTFHTRLGRENALEGTFVDCSVLLLFPRKQYEAMCHGDMVPRKCTHCLESSHRRQIQCLVHSEIFWKACFDWIVKIEWGAVLGPTLFVLWHDDIGNGWCCSKNLFCGKVGLKDLIAWRNKDTYFSSTRHMRLVRGPHFA
jgi:hypothetical protein